ncbi:hypothetical protein, partial [Flavobacterium panici]|uniref:hypothetical protein n=1 Tax=Flavobacterium panici TaxID=2654843 RepID=UPI001C60F126
MSHKLRGTNSLLLLPFSIINLLKFKKTNLKEEREIALDIPHSNSPIFGEFRVRFLVPRNDNIG